jgi:hypothetical protein
MGNDKSPQADGRLSHALTLKLSVRMVEAIDEWRRNQPDLPPRAEAIRRMIMQATGNGLKAKIPQGEV